MGIKEKPPLGLTPRKLHNQERALKIIAAMDRYVREDLPIPTEWIEELRRLYEAS